MSPDHRRRLLASVQRAIHMDPSQVAPTEHLPIVDEAMTVRILDLVMRIGDSMLAHGASANEVTRALIDVTTAFGLSGVHVNITYTAITVGYHRGDQDRPFTLMRVVRATIPDHRKLQRLQALVAEIGSDPNLDRVQASYRAIRRAPFLYRPVVVVFSRALLTAGVSIMLGGSWLLTALTFVAALAAAATQEWLTRLRVPIFFNQMVGGFVTTAVAVLVSALAAAGIEPFDGVRPSIIVSAGIVLMLSGLTVVGAAQDAIDGFALTALGRMLELTMHTVGVVTGILVGLELARVLGYTMVLPSDAPPFGSFVQQILGAVIVAVAVAVYNGSGIRIILVSAVLGAVAIVSHFLATTGGLNEAAACAIGALIASFVGILIAYGLHVPSIAVTTAAIVPLVPGMAVFRGLLALVHTDGAAASSLTLAAAIGIGLAAGASIGLFLGARVRARFTRR
ncbi:threonine/serine exporter family protein [Microbacterium pseudoresistens]|uniref:Uncharacterized membrane protein YjjP (DUF1212 family) n=1 Tax=Microbacterium pseudoresistens TaxID=640634 RepID=A0A7Y9EUS8_9MICO|nr:threonine/serine exporter family protein [Microbacterium pseudoresistens]NYD54184.1 uncharacterized membrane protein YjjP (DUF1212 family) [Microbacterium pseudoresistens]